MKIILLLIIVVETLVLCLVLYYFKVIPQISFLHSSGVNLTSVEEPTPTPFTLGRQEIVGWFAAFDSEKTQRVLPDVIDNFNIFSPMLYRILPDSSLGRHSVPTREYMLSLAQENNVPIAPVITDESDVIRVEKMLNDEEIQQKFIDDLVVEAKAEGFTGWSIDIENLKGTDQKAFSQFIKNTYNRLHENDLKLYTIVYGRTENETYDPAIAHDYKTLGKYSDQIQLMVYNYNNEYTGPGGQTPLEWYRRVLQHAVDSVPREKILVGLSTHGYDWHGDEVTGLTYPEVEEIIEKYNPKITYNKEHSAAVANYTDESGVEHNVWFEDAKTISEKMEIAKKEFGINKFALWRLSAEDPKIWDTIQVNQN